MKTLAIILSALSLIACSGAHGNEDLTSQESQSEVAPPAHIAPLACILEDMKCSGAQLSACLCVDADCKVPEWQVMNPSCARGCECSKELFEGVRACHCL